MSPSIYTSQITLINDESVCTHVSVCPRLVFNLPWGWLTTQRERTTTHFFYVITSSSSSLSVLVLRVMPKRKQRRFQESLMSTRSRSLLNYPRLSFSFCLFSSLYHLSVPSFSRSPGGKVIVVSHAVVSRLSGGDHVLWRGTFLERQQAPGVACLRSVAVKTKALVISLVSVHLQSHYNIRLTLTIWVEKLKVSIATF